MTDRDDAATLRHLVAGGVEFAVVGGWAVIAHGFVRFTADVDVLVADTAAVRAHVTDVLAAAGAVTVNGTPLSGGSQMPDQGWQVNTSFGRVDVLLEGPPPLDLASVLAGAVSTELDGVPIRVAGLAHLGAFKRLAARPHDLRDLEELEALHGPLPVLRLPGIDEP